MATETSSFQYRLKPQSSYSSSFQTRSNTPNRTSTPAPWGQNRAEGYLAVDPYAASISHSIINLQSKENSDSTLEDVELPEQYSVHQPSVPAASTAGLDEIDEYPTSTWLRAFLVDTFPRLLYSYILLRLPSLYFSRVARVFEDADLTMPEIKRMALELANVDRNNVHQVLFTNLSSKAPDNSPIWILKGNWESFIESLLREWKTLNIISVLLLSAILTVLQIESAAIDPLTRYAALSSLMCALMSLLYGCMFIIRFGGMKKPHKAAEWAWEARRTRTVIWWNVWVMLAMPAVWLSWSVTAYIICIMAFVWRTGSTLDGIITPLEPHLAFWPRLIISLLFALGVVYFTLITMTLRQYGSKMDRKWRDRVRGWTDRLIYEQPFPGYMTVSHPHVNQWRASVHNGPPRKYSDDSDAKVFIPSTRFYSRSPSPILEGPDLALKRVVHSMDNESPSLLPPVRTFKAIGLRFQNSEKSELPPDLSHRHLSTEAWAQFLTELNDAWNTSSLPTPQATALRVISSWNDNVFHRMAIEAILCQEYYLEWPESPLYAVYIVDRTQLHDRILPLEQRFGHVPPGFNRLDILDFSELEHRWITLFPARGMEVHFNFPSPSDSPVQYRLRRHSLPPLHDNEDAETETQDNRDDVETEEGDTSPILPDQLIRSSLRRPATPVDIEASDTSTTTSIAGD